MTYADFLARKRRTAPSSGLDCTAADVHDGLFGFQREIVAWAVRRGRAAVWADTGLGKTRIQVEWLRQVLQGEARGLILAPLAVAEQTIREAAEIGVSVVYVRDDDDVRRLLSDKCRIAITNYDRLHKIRAERFAAVVLDESSILKAFSGATKRALVKSFADTPYRLACTATPAPNDIEELCNHADFLGVMTPQEMRSTFFIADSRGEFMRYRLKGHAQSAFYGWLASWAIACRTPIDLGFREDDERYRLPRLHIHDHLVGAQWAPDGELFSTGLRGVTERAQVRRATMADRVAAAVGLVESEPDERWLLWCGMNDEARALTVALDGAVEVRGSDDVSVKSSRLADFADGKTGILVTKPSLAGFGLNFQRCARMAFVGLSDSYEQYYQAIRRCYRFGQPREVHVHIVVSDVESEIVRNVRAKERTAQATTSGLVAAIAERNRDELFAGTSKGDDYEPRRHLALPDWMRSTA